MFSFILVTLIIFYILIFNDCFVNCNFKFIIKIKRIIVILKIICLMEHKVYEISPIRYSYHFLGVKKPIFSKKLSVTTETK